MARKNKSTDKIGMNAYFFRAVESDCNGKELSKRGSREKKMPVEGDHRWEENKSIQNIKREPKLY